MPRAPRSKTFDPHTIGVYHCTQRCVRQAFLCGFDVNTRKNYEYRREWILERLEELAGIFAFEFLHYAVLSNHLHTIVRNRPDLGRHWTNREVARRWWQLYPARRNPDGTPARMTHLELKQWLADHRQVDVWRERLQDLSWLMKSLAEPIARKANAQEEISGRFWQGRFLSQQLTDEAALLACGIYVDLNCVRAGLGELLEQTMYSSVYDRLRARAARAAGRQEQRKDRPQFQDDIQADGWLAPLERDPRQPASSGPSRSGRRISDDGFLDLSLDKYVQLAQWTWRHAGQPEVAPPEHLQGLLVEHGIRPEAWLGVARHYGQWFGRCVGRQESLERVAEKQACRWLRGIRRCGQVFLS